ncbi:hypothetical protein [Actinacidiphila sp. ITFR-21]|uniref:hypothetical protein n=1 Tax=Actinacidiphila sp. ITFR-21 TaxID=3075199 RepID=UPI0028895AD1|nr:hypothetical protein [Streptomyces sp. ITFR-21]WNI18796.1 hypothetical protein RLT57_26895 [Streptomyces sp. ITFR-21]
MRPAATPAPGAGGVGGGGPFRGDHPSDGGPFRGDDPSAVERAGAALAELAAPYRPDAVVSWNGTADVLLAHVVARTLRARRRVLVEDLGRLIIEDVRPGERTVVVTGGAGAGGAGDLTPLIRAVHGHGGRVVAVCSLTAPPADTQRPADVASVDMISPQGAA